MLWSVVAVLLWVLVFAFSIWLSIYASTHHIFTAKPRPVLTRLERLHLTREEVDKLKEASICQHCGGYHGFTCPYIKSIAQTDGITIIYNDRFAELIDEIVYDSDLAEADAWYKAHEVVPDATE